MAKTHPDNHKAQDPKASGQAFSWEGLPPRLAQKALAIKALLEARKVVSPPGEHRKEAAPEVQKLEAQKEPEAQVALARRAKHREDGEKAWPFTGVDLVSRYGLGSIHTRATAGLAAKFLAALARRAKH